MALLSVYLYFLAYEEGEHPGATVYTHKEGNKIKKDYKTGLQIRLGLKTG